jgi:hypothetical protein
MIVDDDDEDESPILDMTEAPKRAVEGASAPDLPAIWQGARRLHLEQRCTGSALGKRTMPSKNFVVLDRGMNRPPITLLVIRDAMFRSDQPVEAFLKQGSNGKCVILVQPTEMGPGMAVAKCSSLYTLGIPLPTELAQVPPGNIRVALRGDRHAGSPTIEEV